MGTEKSVKTVKPCGSNDLDVFDSFLLPIYPYGGLECYEKVIALVQVGHKNGVLGYSPTRLHFVLTKCVSCDVQEEGQGLSRG